jgi:cytoskeleton protein RodZ
LESSAEAGTEAGAEPGAELRAEGSVASHAEVPAAAPSEAPTRAQTTGARLRAAREAAALSVEEVAGHLKVSPRKIAALEDDRWDELAQGPYLRGFVRGYAKLVHEDIDSVLAGFDSQRGRSTLTSAQLMAPSLARPFPERSAVHHDSGTSRLMMFGACVLVLIALGVWFTGTSAFQSRKDAVLAWFGSGSSTVPHVAAGVPPTNAGASTAPPGRDADVSPSGAAASPSGISSTELPVTAASPSLNPSPSLAMSPTPSNGAASAGASSGNAPNPAGSATAATGHGALPSSSVRPASLSSGEALQGAPAAGTPVPAAPILARAERAVGSALLVMHFNEDAWVEVREAHGQTLIAQLNRAGADKEIAGTPPLEVLIGNAPGVSLTYHGTAFDLAPYTTHDKVAHVTLK